jgi:hypothetical protein
MKRLKVSQIVVLFSLYIVLELQIIVAIAVHEILTHSNTA